MHSLGSADKAAYTHYPRWKLLAFRYGSPLLFNSQWAVGVDDWQVSNTLCR